MKINELHQVLNILMKYYDDPDHTWPTVVMEEIYFPATENPISEEDRELLNTLGISQNGCELGEDGETDIYNPDLGWSGYV